MHQSIRAFLVAVALGAIATHASAQATTPSSSTAPQDMNKRVRSLVHQAGESIRAGRYEEARQLLLEAWNLRHAPDIAGVLAQSEIELRRWADAAEHLDFAIANFSATQSDKLLETLRQAFEDTKTHVAQLKIVTNHDGADLIVDGRVVGKSPLQSVVYVEPGRHEVRVKQDDNAEAQAFDVVAGQIAEINVPFRQLKTPLVNTSSPPMSRDPLPPSAPTSLPVSEARKRSIVPLIVGGTVFAAGLGSAIGFRLAANSKDSDAKALLQSVGTGGCQTPTSKTADCGKLLDTARSEDRYANWSTAGFVVAGAALVATASYWFWPREEASKVSQQPARLHLGVVASARNSEVWVTGEF